MQVPTSHILCGLSLAPVDRAFLPAPLASHVRYALSSCGNDVYLYPDTAYRYFLASARDAQIPRVFPVIDGTMKLPGRKKLGSNTMWKKVPIYVGFVILLLMTTSCQLNQPSFSITAGNIGSAFAASETTLLYAHEGKITYAYAASSFDNFQSELNGADKTVAASQGAPAAGTMRQLLSLYQEAMRAVNTPCLNVTCNWHIQISALDRASKAFLKAGNS